MTDPVNVFDVGVEGDAGDPPGYRSRSAQLREDPGDSICPYHYECVEEEWLLVLAGAPTLRDSEGEHQLAEGDVVAFLPGPGGGHKITNGTEDVVRVLMLSTIPKGGLSVCIYPDSEKVGVWPWPGRRLRITESLAYYDGEV
jgi:uncharacterized cupin superfamily protein